MKDARPLACANETATVGPPMATKLVTTRASSVLASFFQFIFSPRLIAPIASQLRLSYSECAANLFQLISSYAIDDVPPSPLISLRRSALVISMIVSGTFEFHCPLLHSYIVQVICSVQRTCAIHFNSYSIDDRKSTNKNICLNHLSLE